MQFLCASNLKKTHGRLPRSIKILKESTLRICVHNPRSRTYARPPLHLDPSNCTWTRLQLALWRVSLVREKTHPARPFLAVQLPSVRYERQRVGVRLCSSPIFEPRFHLLLLNSPLYLQSYLPPKPPFSGRQSFLLQMCASQFSISAVLRASAAAICEGCDVVGCDHAPQAGVAQGV